MVSLSVKDEVSNEAEIGKMYRANYCDKHGRPVIIMRTDREVSVEINFNTICHHVCCRDVFGMSEN